MINITVILGVVSGLLLLLINTWAIKRILKRAQALPPRRTPRYLVLSYLTRFAVLVIVVAFAIWKFGLGFGLGILGGMVLGQMAFFTVGMTRRKSAAS